MKMPIQFDTLDYAKKLETAGVPAVQAEAHASALGDVLGKSIAVHGELLAMEQRIDARIATSDETRNHMFAVSDEKINHRFDVFEHRLDAFEQKFDARFEKLELKFNSEMNTMRWMVGTLIFLVSGLLLRQLQG